MQLCLSHKAVRASSGNLMAAYISLCQDKTHRISFPPTSPPPPIPPPPPRKEKINLILSYLIFWWKIFNCIGITFLKHPPALFFSDCDDPRSVI